MDINVNWLAIVLATASSMVVGMVWYAKPVFGTMWMKMVKLDDKKMQNGAFMAIASTVVVSFITAFVLAHVSFLSNAFFHNAFWQDALSTGFWLWLGFTAARVITHDAFERRPMQLTALTITHELVTIMVMAAIIGLLPPSLG